MKKALVLLLVLALMLTGFYGKAKGINSPVTVQAGGFISLVSVTGSGQQITIVPSVLMNSGPVYISISNLAYIRNLAAGGTYPNFLVANSTGKPAGTGSIIIQSAVQNVNVLVNPLNAGSVADYTI